MSKKIFIDASSKEETRIALTLNGRLDDFEIETVKKVAVKILQDWWNPIFDKGPFYKVSHFKSRYFEDSSDPRTNFVTNQLG